MEIRPRHLNRQAKLAKKSKQERTAVAWGDPHVKVPVKHGG